jgi:hypothetical protein
MGKDNFGVKEAVLTFLKGKYHFMTDFWYPVTLFACNFGIDVAFNKVVTEN